MSARPPDLSTANTFVQRQWLPIAGWLSIAGFFASVAIAYGAAAGSSAGWVSAAVGLVLTPMVARLMSQRIVVAGGKQPHLRAGAAVIPLAALGDVRVLDAVALKTLRRDNAAAQGFWAAPGWCAQAVVCAVSDDTDPHMFWVIGSNRAPALADAINRYRPGGQPHGTMSA